MRLPVTMPARTRRSTVALRGRWVASQASSLMRRCRCWWSSV